MNEDCIFCIGWNKTSTYMEKFLKENKISYVPIYQEKGEPASILDPNMPMIYKEKDFESLKSKIIEFGF